ncbi:hypothetical protein [Marinicella meishanensis]|uniref:hypothetical protein n=1 Tax=Marinicella meishanensis TaxID=2873263 RepID=UPI001CBC326B|nr:hypothetical protein [Marinicella sp. NBU2979]
MKANIPANTNDYPILIDSPFLTQLNVNVTFDNGTAIPDATNIQLSTSNVQVAPISTLDDPDTTDINEFTTFFGSIGNESSGGNGTFFIHGAAAGTVTLTASAVDPQTNRTSSANFTYTILPGPEPFDRLAIEPVASTLPANVFGLTPREAFGTVYMTEATISFRDPLGNFVNPATDDDTPTFGVAINPVSVAAFSTLDDPETVDDGDPLTEENEIFILLGQGPVDVVAGRATIFIWADSPGVATITASAFDQFTQQNISAQFDIVVDNGPVDLPTIIQVAGSGANYINGSGGPQSQVIQVFVDAAPNVPVPNPNGFNNVMIDITTDQANSGEKLSGVNAQGLSVEGTSISIDTANGVGSFQLLSGNEPNTVIMTVTTDRADNNVDNGLQDPLTAQDNFVISDGVLFGLDITTPNINNLFINRVDGGVAGTGGIGNLDGSYSITVSAIGTDKGGNPALPQTVQFGLIDSPVIGFPQDGPGTFVNSSNDGDPEEGGDLFTSLSGDFINGTAEVQPGDTLMVFGEEILRNEDLESAVTVENILSDTSLRISETFNRNDLSGTIINDLDIFPYIIGRAVDGNINAVAIIDENGVASTELNYPVSKLGKITSIYAKGQGATVNGVTRSVTDVELMLYPGAGSIPGTELTPIITVSPTIIPANETTPVTVCVLDAARHPIQGADVSWAFVGGNGTGEIDGVTGSGVMENRTGPDGCATGQATVTGVIDADENTGFIFNVGSISCLVDDATVCIQVASPGAIYLSAAPAFHNSSGVKIISLFLFNGNGQGIANVPLFGSCMSNGGQLVVQVQPGSTDENGMATANVLAGLDGINESFSGTCEFTTGSGEPTATVQFNGQDLCVIGVSPNVPPGCGP